MSWVQLTDRITPRVQYYEYMTTYATTRHKGGRAQ